MAQDPKSQWIVVSFQATENGKTVVHGLRMKKGTADALGLSKAQLSVGFVEKTVRHPASSYRRAYIGGPLIEVKSGPKVQAVAVGPRQSKARTNAKMILKGDGPGKYATIYYTGKRSTAVKWLEANTTLDSSLFGNSMQLYSTKGKHLNTKLELLGN